MHVLIVGLGVTGEALARHAAGRGWRHTVVEDHPEGELFERRRNLVVDLGGEVVGSTDPSRLRELVEAADLVVASPGVPVVHPVYGLAAASDTRVVSEIELASTAASVPIVAITGTNGKTTVTSLVTDMLEASGRRALAAGNIGRPLIEAVATPGIDVVVAEVSSFQLHYTESFRPSVAVVLNVADDHLDWHPSLEHYRLAKTRIFVNQRDDDVLILNADDPVTAAMADGAPARTVWFSARGAPDAYRVERGALRDAGGTDVVAVADLPRSRPHDLANATAALAATMEAGGTAEGTAAVLREFRGLPHRLALVGEAGGVAYYDDSKATNPQAAATAVAAFPSVVLLAGGRNKGLPMSPLADVAGRLRAVVAFGEAAREVEEVFAALRPVVRASSMHEAVRAAQRLAEPGDVVLLAPGCASFDAYPDYAARGDDFAAHVRGLIDRGAGRANGAREGPRG